MAAVLARSSRDLTFRLGVSAIALSVACFSGQAWAQAEMTPISPDSSQAAASGQDQNATEPAQAAVPNPSQAAAPGQEQNASAAAAPGTDIVVTGRRAALEQADQRKRRSETIIDSVVADDAGKLPDNSITEVLQRVAGVSIVRFASLGDPDHFSVEGSGVQVRGLSGVASRLNGREIFSANNGRAILWGDVTPELMAAVDVYKASTADLIEGGTGGQIDLRTKLPFDFKGGFHVAATGEISRGDLSRKKDPSASLLLTDRWSTGIGDIGVLVDVAYSKFSSLSQFYRIEPYYKTHIDDSDYYIPGGFDYGDEAFQRRRSGIYAAAQWAPSDDLSFTGTFFQSRYKNRSSDYGAQVTSQSLAVDPANSTFDSIGGLLTTDGLFTRDATTFEPSGNPLTSSGNKGVVKSNTVTRDYSLSFQWTPGDGPLSLKGALQRVDSSQVYNRLDVFREVGFPASFGLDLTGDLPQITVPEGTQATFDDPANYFWSASMPHNERNKGRLDAANLDAEYTFDDSFLRSVKVGGRVAKRTERDFGNSYNWVALGRGWNGDPQLTFANAAPGDIEYHSFRNFFRGDTALPGNLMFASYDLVSRMNRIQLTNAPPAGFCSADQLYNCSSSGPLPVTGYGNQDEIRAPGFILPIDQSNNRTTTQAAYALVRFGQSDGLGITGNVGLRVLHLRNTGSGFIQQNANTFVRNGETVSLGAQAIARGGTASFWRYLPSVNVDYSPSSKVKLRAAYNVTLDNPSFLTLRATGSIGVNTTSNPASTPENNLPGIFTNFTADTGNPLLKPTLSNNVDLSLEYYARAGTSFHVAPFYKRLTNLPVYTLTERDVTVVFTDGTSENVSASAQDYINSPKAATIKGVEFGGRVFLDMLPGLLSGFGVEANYTYIESKNPGDLYRDINGVTHSDAPIVGLSKHNFNATLLYERKRVSARIAYSWRSSYLQSTNSNGTNPTYSFFDRPDDPSADSIRIALPVYGNAYGSFDAGIRYKLTDNFSIGIQGTNLTAATQRTSMGGYPDDTRYLRSWFQSDRRVSAEINVAF